MACSVYGIREVIATFGKSLNILGYAAVEKISYIRFLVKSILFSSKATIMSFYTETVYYKLKIHD